MVIKPLVSTVGFVPPTVSAVSSLPASSAAAASSFGSGLGASALERLLALL